MTAKAQEQAQAEGNATPETPKNSEPKRTVRQRANDACVEDPAITGFGIGVGATLAADPIKRAVGWGATKIKNAVGWGATKAVEKTAEEHAAEGARSFIEGAKGFVNPFG